MSPVYDSERFGIHFVASPRHADLLLVTGPVTRNMEVPLRKTYEATPAPKLVVAVGDCARTCGVFKGSYAVAGSVDQVVPVNVFVDGCPPEPARHPARHPRRARSAAPRLRSPPGAERALPPHGVGLRRGRAAALLRGSGRRGRALTAAGRDRSAPPPDSPSASWCCGGRPGSPSCVPRLALRERRARAPARRASAPSFSLVIEPRRAAGGALRRRAIRARTRTGRLRCASSASCSTSSC